MHRRDVTAAVGLRCGVECKITSVAMIRLPLAALRDDPTKA